MTTEEQLTTRQAAIEGQIYELEEDVRHKVDRIKQYQRELTTIELKLLDLDANDASI